MTLLVILIATAAGGWWLSTSGPYLADNLNVYVAIFIAGLAAAALAAVRSLNRRSIVAAIILVANFGLSHWAWSDADPVLTGGILDLATAAYFYLLGVTRWEAGIGLLFSLSAIAAVLTGWADLIPDHTERPAGLAVFAYPDIAAWIGHGANVILGAGAGDWGRLARVRDWLAGPVPWTRAGNLAARMVMRRRRAPVR